MYPLPYLAFLYSEGDWVEALLWFGFDVTHSRRVGTERVLIALAENPEWMQDMFSRLLEVNIQLLDMVLKPSHKRAIDRIHSKGAKAYLHSCGDVNPFVPELIEIGRDALNPLEVKAGMDPVHLKKIYGKDLVFHGGINAVLLDKPDAIRAEMERVVPVMKEKGGYIFSPDHSVPSSVSLEDFRNIVKLAKKLGQY